VNNQDEKEEICVVDDEYQPMENQPVKDLMDNKMGKQSSES